MNIFFDWTASASRFAPFTLARAEDINTSLDLVSYGFDLVTASLALKAPSASPTFSGTVTMSGAASVLLPSPGAVGENSTKAATTAWVQSLVGSLSVGLPSQTGNSGKVLGTDGTSAAWQAEGWVSATPMGTGGVVSVSADSTLPSAARVVDTSALPAGSVVTFPDATTLPVGASIILRLTTDRGMALSGGGLIQAAGNYVYFLTDNSTVAGTWKIMSPASLSFQALTTGSIVSIKGASTTLRGTRPTNGVAQLTASTFLCAGGSISTGAGADLVIATVDAAAGVTAGSVTTVGTDTFAQWSKLLPVTGGYIYLYRDNGNNIRGVGVTVSGSTISASAPVTIASGLTATSSSNGDVVRYDAASSGATAVLVYRPSGGSSQAIAMTLSGTTITAGSATQIAAIFDGSQCLVASSASSFFWVARYTDGAYKIGACALSVSGTTITVGTLTTYTTAVTFVTYETASAVYVSSTSLMFACNRDNSTFASFAVTDITTTPVITLGVTFATTTTPSRSVLAAAGSYFAWATGQNALYNEIRLLTVSGSTVTQAGATLSGYSSGGTFEWGGASSMTWDGTYLVAPYNGSTYLLSVGAGGAAYVATISDVVGYSGYTRGNQCVWRLTGKRYVVFQGQGMVAQVARFGGIS